MTNMSREANQDSSARLSSKKIEIEGRIFLLDLLRLHNGCFVNISEDRVSRLGAITISIKTKQRSVNSSTLIPERRGSIFSSMVGELIAEKTEGIGVVSLYLREEIEPSIMKPLLSRLSDMLSEIDRQDDA